MIDFLFGVPSTLTSRYIIREDFVYKIFRQLQKEEFDQGRILVHGLAGTGKTIAVSQGVTLWSLSASVEDNGDSFRVAYWTKIGEQYMQVYIYIFPPLQSFKTLMKIFLSCQR